MAKNKTTENDDSVEAYINSIADEKKRSDVSDIIKLFSKKTGLPPKMWGTGIVGFGSYHYKYESGREGDAPLAGLAARVNNIALYLGNFDDREAMLQQLGKYKTAKSCIYVQKLEDVSTKVLGEMVVSSVKRMKEKYPPKTSL